MKFGRRIMASILTLIMLLGMTAVAEDELPDSIDMGDIVVVDGVAINEDGEEIECYYGGTYDFKEAKNGDITIGKTELEIVE